MAGGDCDELQFPRAEEEVISRVTKSRGVVGPGNCADR